ncbi:glycoside hydrolase family 18 protein [Streptomyces sp. MB09-02B]|uniref:glycoside hydrolase family 18 protein n=1 Tax=Streptomyces sp. MB09-02B TaxID=3028667 RepID=UPI0029BD9BD9|nr:glycoside hydrolase family 18 protein [Streptomyces sp. MB09-02B]MDX3640322.1 glycoside hydrolase family 18 protein [Streptomyces sp. MB09-02B]
MRLGPFSTVLIIAAASTMIAAAPPDVPRTRGQLVGERVGYFPGWGVWDGFHVKDIDRAASKLTVVNYAFAQVTKDGECIEANNTPLSDAWADYQRPASAAESVDGVADRPEQNLKGNFNQLRELKQRHPHLRVVMSLMSSHFSDSALTPDSRRKLVSSCVELFIKGNLPELPGEEKTEGGPGSAFGIFDGIDIDWEYPAVQNAHGHVYRQEDTRNFTLLMAEFRRQLDEVGREKKRAYILTAALPPSVRKREKIEAAEVAEYADFLNIMTYDFAGPWSADGPTDHSANLHLSTGETAESRQLSAAEAVRAYVKMGVPARKVVLGVPFYGYGWKGVPAENDGLYQSAASAVPTHDYRFIARQPGKVFRDPAAQAAWKYDARTGDFWTYDDATAVQAKAAFVREQGFGGIMMWTLSGDDEQGTLVDAVHTGLQNRG